MEPFTSCKTCSAQSQILAEGKTALISGSGNVATHAAENAAARAR